MCMFNMFRNTVFKVTLDYATRDVIGISS
jgi:hypothetical protein